MQLPMIKEKQSLQCYHCGEDCRGTTIFSSDHVFCCEGCKSIFELLSENNLCTYYSLQNSPGFRSEQKFQESRFSYLKDPEMQARLLVDSSDQIAMASFFVPHIHCSSCVWLLENLHKLNPNILSSRVDFMSRKVSITFDKTKIDLAGVVALMASTGYEPLISLKDLDDKVQKEDRRNQVIKIGIAGFCFGNIMMMSFPEYFSGGDFQNTQQLKYLFSFLNLALALPVLFYCASVFFVSGWKALKNKHLNIDAPIALAILVTFVRSVFEITTFSGPGYLDSMSGIVFFMLLGRYFQNRTYHSLSFDRDYKSYFPVGVMVVREGMETSIPATQLKPGDRIVIRNNELIPADSILESPFSHIDYSFISGESLPVKKSMGDLVYAGARQCGGAIELKVVKPVSQSYLTGLWNNTGDKSEKKQKGNYIEKVNRYFTLVVLLVASLSALCWWPVNASTALNAFTAVLIVACPCGLLLTTTFTYGNIMRVLGRNKLYLKNSRVIEQVASCNAIVFDKTGTITSGAEMIYRGEPLTGKEKKLVASLAMQSNHPLSKKIADHFGLKISDSCIDHYVEFSGKGLMGISGDTVVALGNGLFVIGKLSGNEQTAVYVSINDEPRGHFAFKTNYRTGIRHLVRKLSRQHQLHVLTGDNESEKQNLVELFGHSANLLFNQLPEEKRHYIDQLQKGGGKVMMLGDGLNDAGALAQSQVGIAISDNTNTFSPACDAILDGSSLSKLHQFIQMAKAGKYIILLTFVFSLVYNFIGLYYAVQGLLAPVIAAILMPLSTLTIVLLTTVLTSVLAKKYSL